MNYQALAFSLDFTGPLIFTTIIVAAMIVYSFIAVCFIRLVEEGSVLSPTERRVHSFVMSVWPATLAIGLLLYFYKWVKKKVNDYSKRQSVKKS